MAACLAPTLVRGSKFPCALTRGHEGPHMDSENRMDEEADQRRWIVSETDLVTSLKRHPRDTSVYAVVVAGELAFALLAAAAEGKEAPRDLWHARRAGDDVRHFELE